MIHRPPHLERQTGWLLQALLALLLACLVLHLAPARAAAGIGLAPSNRVAINLGQTPWRYLKDADPSTAMQPGFNDSAWALVGVPHTPSDNDTFINMISGGGEGQLTGNINWYRKHFTMDPKYAGRKVFIEFEGAHVGAQVYINGVFVPGNSTLNPQATHVVGFVPFLVDVTDQLKFDGSDNVLAVKVARGDKFFNDPGFSGAFRFGQSDAGLFRPVWMYITDPVHIPRNVYSVLNTWGTYVATESASDASASVRVQTNVLNEKSIGQVVTLTTQIVDAGGNVVATAQDTRTVPANVRPGLHPLTFDQSLTVDRPTLWYPNNSIYGKPYMYRVLHTVSIGGTVVDATETPLGIRTITWDQDFPIINGKPHFLWGASGRYDYPALGSAVPEEQQWRDLSLLANAGGNLYRPGHSSQGPEFLAAADAFGIMMVQPSGDGENGFATACAQQPCDRQTLKTELHRDMIVHDRNNPSVLAWEADNGVTDTAFAQSLKALSRIWDPILTRAQADRTPDPANGDILGCSRQGCEIGTKNTFPDSPAWGSEYWGAGVMRDSYDYELAFAAPFLKDWRGGVAVKAFGMAHWYLAETPGEVTDYVDGNKSETVRGNGASMLDGNRIPKLLYYIYQAAWTPFEIKPVVKLAHHWNRSGDVTVNAFSNCPAVRLLLNGQPQGSDQVPNPPSSDPGNDIGQDTTLMPAQAHWRLTWAPGTLTAQCLDSTGLVLAVDELKTAGAPDHIVLSVEPGLLKPNGERFAVTANGSDAAFIKATVVDAQGNWVPTATPNITFDVSGPGTYRGGADHIVTAGKPQGYHSPGDPELAAEGGMTKIAVKAQFTTGTVTVHANSPGLGAGSATFNVMPVVDVNPSASSGLQIIAQPIGQTVTIGQSAQFTVTTAGAGPLSFQWMKAGAPIAGATSFAYTTPATQAGDNGASFSVKVGNAAGNVVSAAALLTVVTPSAPAIVVQPAAQSITLGQSAQFAVVASGSPLLTYQWSKDGASIPDATNAVYNTPQMTLADSGSTYKVVVSNSVGSVTSANAGLTVGAAVAPGIIVQPVSRGVATGQPVTFSVLATGSGPLHYQWFHGGTPVGNDAAALALVSARTADAGNYSVTVSNNAGSITSDIAILTLSGGGGPNLALNKVATASSVQNDGLPASAVVDGKIDSRWSSAPEIDPSWVAIDLGAPQTFDRVVLVWENAAAKAYQIQVSNDNQNWTTVYTQNAGNGGTEDFTFRSTTARYVRMFGTQRTTQYGYSLFEFEVYDVAQCGDAGERYTISDDQNTVRDNLSGLTWRRFNFTLADQGAQFTQPMAQAYCEGIGMRLPTQAEALAISAVSYASCGFPNPWNTWSSTPVPNQDGFAYFVSSAGASTPGIIDNSPGWALCVLGTSSPAPAIVRQPVSQTVALGQTAQFNVVANGDAPMSFQWLKNGAQVAITTVPSFTTPATQAADNGAAFSVVVTNAAGSATSAAAILTVSSGSTPAITTQPANQAVQAGQSAHFTVTASGAAPLNYEWRKNGQVVASGANPAYDTPAAVAGDNGASFSVVVSNSAGSVTSNNAILSVSTAGDGGATGGATSTNLALGKTATTSGLENAGYTAGAAVDGNLGSRWSSAFVDPSWIAIDLGSVQTFDRVVLRWENAYGKAYQIQTSNDYQNWTTVYTQPAGNGGTEDISFASTDARYVRMLGSQRSSQFGYSLFEFEVYNKASTPQFAVAASAGANGSISPAGNVQVSQGASQTFTIAGAPGFGVGVVTVDGQNVGALSSYTFNDVRAAHTIGATFAPSAASVNLALNKNATSSGDENGGLGAPNAVDGKADSRWSSAFVDASWIAIDLGSVQAFNRVVLHWENAYGKAYQLQTSNDGQNWTKVYEKTNGTGGTEDISFASTSARYIRLLGSQRSSQYGYSLFEFEVYNTVTDPVADAPPDYTIFPGFVGVDLRNNTNGKWSDDQVYVAVIARDPANGQFAWLKPDGTIVPAAVADNDAPNHLSKNGQNYSNYFFTLAQAKLLKLPKLDSGRVFVSLGGPLFIKILEDANHQVGFAGPNVLNPTDPNIDVNFDWYEFTNNNIGLWINTTQVDQFSFPLLTDVYAANRSWHKQTGISERRDALFAAYQAETPAAFQQGSVSPFRIMAPAKSSFNAGQPNGSYFAANVDEVWNHYSSNTLTIDMWGNSRRFDGTVQGGKLVFTEVDKGNGAFVGGTYTVGKPTTQDILEGSGTLATGNSTELALEAQICAAFNRHIMLDSSKWATPSAWYAAAPANAYAKFWHDHSVGGLAYGFAYDDVSDQSSTIMAVNPEHAVFTIGW